MKIERKFILGINISLILKLLLYCFTLLLPYYNFCFASEVNDGILRIQKAYENIKDMEGEFIQKSYIKDLKRTDTYEGQFFIKPPKMRWEYKGDKSQIVYISGDEIIIYQIKEKQAFKTRFDRETYGQAPIALLSGFGNIKKEFEVSKKSEKTLILKPKRPMGNIVSIEIILSDKEFPIGSITVIDSLSNKIDIYLKNIKINTALKNKLFEFSPPEGTTIIHQ
jgi:outer membrane lipoprotein carrier protein